ncbi:Ribonuclease H1 [Cichlidogyrus casuarinus]|uniref:Ribonuclease H n=1 Tax=Cichlidogyrus casuarinus TaxID=1844966 RepID=A0ABD2QGH9_9PLAT
MPYYAVRNGRVPGVYNSWSECHQNVSGFPRAIYKKFHTHSEALTFCKGPTEHPTASAKIHESRVDENTVDWTVVYTDGSCKGPQSNRRAGIGIFWGDNHPWNLSKKVVGKQTNIKAEMDACSEAIEHALSKEVPKLIIRTDSEFTMKVVEQWLPKWQRNGFRLANGQEVKNSDAVRRLAKAANNPRIKIKFEHVRGHKGIYGNTQADQLANLAADS